MNDAITLYIHAHLIKVCFITFTFGILSIFLGIWSFVYQPTILRSKYKIVGIICIVIGLLILAIPSNAYQEDHKLPHITSEEYDIDGIMTYYSKKCHTNGLKYYCTKTTYSGSTEPSWIKVYKNNAGVAIYYCECFPFAPPSDDAEIKDFLVNDSLSQ